MKPAFIRFDYEGEEREIFVAHDAKKEITSISVTGNIELDGQDTKGLVMIQLDSQDQVNWLIGRLRRIREHVMGRGQTP